MKKGNLIVVPMAIEGEDSYVLFVVLQKGNIDRVCSYDPAEIDISDMPPSFRRLDIKAIHIMYASQEEADEMEADPSNCLDVIKKLARGWSYRPDLGDHDDPPETYGPFST